MAGPGPSVVRVRSLGPRCGCLSLNFKRFVVVRMLSTLSGPLAAYAKRMHWQINGFVRFGVKPIVVLNTSAETAPNCRVQPYKLRDSTLLRSTACVRVLICCFYESLAARVLAERTGLVGWLV